MEKIDAIAEYLRTRGIVPTLPRVEVVQFLQGNPSHPTVDEVYQSLKNRIPSLSKTTVYNILRNLVEKGIVSEVLSDPEQKRYELFTTPHGHFKCQKCGRVYDVDLPLDLKSTIHTDHILLSVHILCIGICRTCNQASH